MAKTTVAALAAEVETLTATVEALAKLVQAGVEKPAPKPSRKPKAASVKPSKAERQKANKLAHRQFLAFYGRGEAAKARKAIPAKWLEREFYASRLAEIEG